MWTDRIHVGLCVVGLLVASLCGCGATDDVTASAEESFEVTQIHEGYDLGYYPDVSSERVVWYGRPDDGGDAYEIYTWTEAGGPLRITDDALNDIAPRVSGDRVVWQHNMASDENIGGEGAVPYDFEILTWTPEGGIVRITEDGSWDRGPQVSGDRVVWSGRGGADGGDDWEIFTWTPQEGVVQLTQNDLDDEGLSISGDRVVWDGGRCEADGADREVFTWTSAEGVGQLTDNGHYDGAPWVSGDRVVWSAGVDPGGDDDAERILTWTPASGVTRISQNIGEVGIARVFGDRVVWSGRGGSDGGGDWDIFTWAPGEGLKQLTDNDIDDTAPQVSDGLVVWVTFEGRWVMGEGTVMAWAVGSAKEGQMLGPIADGIMELPALSGNRVVWADNDQEITTAVYVGP